MTSMLTDTIKCISMYSARNRAATFKAFLAAVLIQFAILSFLAITIPSHITALPKLRAIMTTAEYWWGFFSLLGALNLLFEHYIKNWVLGTVLGYTAALISFMALVYDFMFHRPPIFAGVVFAATAALFLGGLLYDQLRRR